MGKDHRQKRKGQYYHQAAKKSRYNKLDAGMRGVLITCNNREREAVQEAYNLLDEYAEILYGPQATPGTEEVADASNSEESEEDIAAALQKEVRALQKTKPSQRRFQQVDTGTRNIIFIKTSLDNPTELVNKIFSDCYDSKQKKSRYIMRMMPVLGTCSANDDNISKTVNKVLAPYIGHGKPTSYCCQIKVRNNDSMCRTHLIPVLGRAVEELNPYAIVNLSSPEHNIIIDVMKTVACIGCVQEFSKFKKYNLQEVTNVGECSQSPVEKVVVSEAKSTMQVENEASVEIDTERTTETSKAGEEKKEVCSVAGGNVEKEVENIIKDETTEPVLKDDVKVIDAAAQSSGGDLVNKDTGVNRSKDDSNVEEKTVEN